MNLGLSKEAILALLEGPELSPAAAERISEAIELNNKAIQKNLNSYIHSIFVARMRPQGPR